MSIIPEKKFVGRLNVRVQLAPTGINTKVELQHPITEEWWDVSSYLRGFTINAHVDEITSIVLDLGTYQLEGGVTGGVDVFISLPPPPETSGSEIP
jgi:hypothetical protein